MITYEQLAEEIRVKYPQLDQTRIDRALTIVKSRTIRMAMMNEDGIDITPTRDAYAVKSPRTVAGSETWYIVRPRSKSCNCYDSTKAGHICKHRIAVFLYTEFPRRNSVVKD